MYRRLGFLRTIYMWATGDYVAPPPISNIRATDSGNIRTTSAGDRRVITA